MKLIVRLTVVFVLLHLWALGQVRTVGTTYLEEGAYEGYTLIAPIFTPNDNTIYLIDNCGDVVHSWPTTEYTGLVAKLLPNGNLLRAYVVENEHFAAGGLGGGVQLWDWEGNKIWDYVYSNETHAQHHDVAPVPDGSVLLLTWESRDSVDWIAAGRNPGSFDTSFVWTEKIVQVMPSGATTGDIIWEWDAWDHLIQEYDSEKANYGVIADHPELLDINYLGWGGSDDDWMHGNSVSYNADLDQVIMSCRHMHQFFVIDHSTTTQEAAGHSGGDQGMGGDYLYRWGNPQSYGRGTGSDQKLFAQHDAHWIDNGLNDGGYIMVFNNGERPDTNYSTVDIIAPPVDGNGAYSIASGQPFGPSDVSWSYTGTESDPLFAKYISGGQRLPNGNTLICEGTKGRVLEIDQTGTKVWEYVNPVNTLGISSQGDALTSFPADGYNNWVFRAYKYGADYPAFVGQNLDGTVPVEENPWSPNPCLLIGIDEVVANSDIMTLYPNPSRSTVSISGLTTQTSVKVIDATGRLVLTGTLTPGQSLDVSELPIGFYSVNIPLNDRTVSLRLVKN